MTTHRFTFKTWAETRSNRRDRTYIIHAENFEDAHEEAVKQSMHVTRAWNASHYATLIDVDDRGLPEDCPHLEHHPTARWSDGAPLIVSAYRFRWDGGRICVDCALRDRLDRTFTRP